MNIKKVLVIYHYIAHYRKPIFDLLCNSNNVDYYLAADDKANINSLNVLSRFCSPTSQSISKKWIGVSNFWITKDVLWQKGVLGLALSRRFDSLIFLGNMYFISTWVAVVVARLRGKKVYFWTHGFRNKERSIKGFLRTCFYRLANGLFLYGNQAKEILIEKGFSPDRLHVIYNSLDFYAQTREVERITLEDRLAKRHDLQINEDDKLIIATGRIVKDKKFDLLIDAIAELNSSGVQKYSLIVVGDGPGKIAMEKKACKLSVTDHIIFFGACYEERELAMLISMSDVSVVPGDIGLSGIHSLTYGTPVVTHDNFETHKPEFEAIRDGLSGSFYRAGSVHDMVVKIKYWAMKDRNDVFRDCRSIICNFYNTEFQKSVLDKVIIEG